MHRSRIAASLLSVFAIAACSPDNHQPLAPAISAVAAQNLSVESNGRFIVAAGNSGFSKSFASDVAALGGTIESSHDGAGIAVVTGLSEAAANQLNGLSGVSEVQADADISLDTPLASVEAEADAAALGDVSPLSVANPATAGLYSWQWNMRAISANKAWMAGKLGDAGVTVAIIDTGIDYNAPDLNGLVDLSRSTSFVASDNAVAARYFPLRHIVTDMNGHGTNVATQVSSKAVAFAGVTSKTTLIGVKVLPAIGSGSSSNVLNGVLWAADHGADVANMSLGGGFSKAGNGQFLSLINRVFNYAGKKGMLIVVAAGNSSADLQHNGNMYATYCDAPHVVCVSAVGPATAAAVGTPAQDAPSFYTNYGRSAITVAGPGGNANAPTFSNSTWIWGIGNASWVWSYCAKDRIASFTPITGAPVLTACRFGNRVTGMIGTSQAAPHVAGLAALLVVEMGKGQPHQIKNAIQKSADNVGGNGTDAFYGRGRINVGNALGL